ncbi:MAG: metalloregulator ArsR/SmtB family transcription factor [Actinomycetia bacterium]|nr:metalloregulator ArsR/SmtB family transcription factor [Actinomycetes bacterium]
MISSTMIGEPVGRPAIIELTPTPLDDDELIARIYRGLGDATRIRILRLLLDGPMSQKDIVAVVGLSQGRVSQHLTCLIWCGYLESEKRGRVVEYRIANGRVAALLDLGVGFLESTQGDIGSCRIVEEDDSTNVE